MNYGMYIAASAVSTQMARTDVLSNNLSNASTVGFKPDFIAVRARDVVRREDNLPFEDSDRLLERLGAGVMPTETSVRQRQGPIETTGRPLDLALEGEGFFVVRAGAGDAGLRLTRDGRFATNSGGELVTTDGHPVVGAGGGVIRITPGAVTEVRADGAIVQGGAVVGRLRIATVADASSLRKQGDGLFGAGDGGALSLRDGSARVHQGAVEGSGVDLFRTMMGVTSAARSAQGNLRMISMIDDNMRLAISRFARVS